VRNLPDEAWQKMSSLSEAFVEEIRQARTDRGLPELDYLNCKKF
jgi:hypothetical protein